MRTLYSFGAVVGLGVAAAMLTPSARATDWSVSVGVGLPGVVVVEPARPVYVPPPPRYYYVPPAYQPGYYSPPGYYRPPVVDDEDRYYRHRDWHRHHHDHDDDHDHED